MDLAVLARYPFLPEAAGRIGNEGPSLEDLLSDAVYEGARQRGRERLLAAIDHGEIPHAPITSDSPQREVLEELLAYAYARILVSALGDAYVVRRHALAEAVRVRAHLDAEADDEAVRASAAHVALPVEIAVDGEWSLHFTDYLKYAVHLKDLDWKLVRQPLSRGGITIAQSKLARLIQEGLRRRIEGELPRQLSEEVEKAVAEDLVPVREAARVRQEQLGTGDGFGKVDLPLIPPCMHHILGQLTRGENVAHSGRFALTTFLNTIGMTSEDIMRLFSTAPDFREDLTRYQVEHITGVSSGTTYTPPGCQAMQTFGICYNSDDVCRSRKRDGEPRVKHPLAYYRYMKEAEDALAPIFARVLVANEADMRREAALHYGFLRRCQEVAALPHVEQVTHEDALALVEELKVPVKLDDQKRLVFDSSDRYLLLDLVDSNAIRVRLARRAPPPAPKDAAPEAPPVAAAGKDDASRRV